MEAKKCSCCKIEKPANSFAKRSRSRDGLNPNCRSCVSLKNKKYYASAPQEVKERAAQRKAAWISQNKERQSEYDKARWAAIKGCPDALLKERERAALAQKEARLKNPSKARAAEEKYRLNNLDKFAAKESKRRADQDLRAPKWLTENHLFVISEFYSASEMRSRLTGVKHQVDHIVPLRGELVSGLHVPWNLKVITAEENLKKSNRFNAA